MVSATIKLTLETRRLGDQQEIKEKELMVEESSNEPEDGREEESEEE